MILPRAVLDDLANAVRRVGLLRPEFRSLLLRGIPAAFTFAMRRLDSPWAQLLSDLDILNGAPAVAHADVHPLRMWLHNAKQLGDGHEGATEFENAIRLSRARLEEAGAMVGSEVLGEGFEGRSRRPELSASLGAELPRLLATTANSPLAVLMRLNLQHIYHGGGSRIDEWTFICHSIASRGMNGWIDALRIVDEVQSSSMSEALSKWAFEFLDALSEDLGVLEWSVAEGLRTYAANEVSRWAEVEERVLEFSARRSTSNAPSMATRWSALHLHLGDWWHSIVRQLSAWQSFRADPDWIGARLRPQVCPKRIEEFMQQAVLCGAATVDADGQWECAGVPLLSGESGESRRLLVSLHRTMLQLAAQSMDAFPRSERYLIGRSFSIPRASIPGVAAQIDELALSLSDREEGDAIYHLQVALFPVALNE